MQYSSTISEMLIPTVLAWRLARNLVSFSMDRVNFSFMEIHPDVYVYVLKVYVSCAKLRLPSMNNYIFDKFVEPISSKIAS